MTSLRRLLPKTVRRLARRVIPAGRTASAALHPPPVAAVPPSPPVSLVREIRTPAELDEALAQAEAAFAISDDEGRSVVNGFRYVHDHVVPPDPYSDAYRECQMRIYAHVSGRQAYEARINERSPFDLPLAKACPFPYQTHSPDTVGTQLIQQGLIVRHMPAAPPARIVEFGPGWGNLTMHLARMGYGVTAVEIEPAFVELIRHRAERVGVTIAVVEQEMLDFCPREPVDVAIFFESFHHCADHLAMLRRLDRIVGDEGALVFASEPIADYPHPWGVRLDGLSVWSMRKYGWLELGFDTTYFVQTLRRFGWEPQRHTLPGCAGADVIVAHRRPRPEHPESGV